MNKKFHKQLNSIETPRVFYTDIDVGSQYEFKVYDLDTITEYIPRGKNARYWVMRGEFVSGFLVNGRTVDLFIPQNAFSKAVSDCPSRDNVSEHDSFVFAFTRINKYVLKIHRLKRCDDDEG